MMFGVLNPRVLDAVRTLDTKALVTLEEDVREFVRAHLERGLIEGRGAREIARGLRAVVGIAPEQAAAVARYRAELEVGKRGLHRRLRDRRYDKAALTPERIDRMVRAYEKRMVAHTAETICRTATLDILKLAQKLSVEDAVRKGVYDPRRLVKTWVAALDDRVRDEHRAMHGETVRYDEPYSNGEDVPGSSTFNCRCMSRFFQLPA